MSLIACGVCVSLSLSLYVCAGTRQWSEEECSEFEEGLQCIRTPLAPRVVNMLCVKTPQFAWPISRCIATVAILGSPAVTTQCCATSFPSVVAVGK